MKVYVVITRAEQQASRHPDEIAHLTVARGAEVGFDFRQPYHCYKSIETGDLYYEQEKVDGPALLHKS